MNINRHYLDLQESYLFPRFQKVAEYTEKHRKSRSFGWESGM